MGKSVQFKKPKYKHYQDGCSKINFLHNEVDFAPLGGYGCQVGLGGEERNVDEGRSE